MDIIKYSNKSLSFKRYLLAGDIGGTKTKLGVVGIGKKPEIVFTMEFRTAVLKSVVPAIEKIVSYAKEKHDIRLNDCCLAVAGPGDERFVKTINIKWNVDAKEIQKKTSLKKVLLVNDFHAIGYGLRFAGKKDLFVVQEGKGKGNKAIIGAGTGLGKSIVIEDKPFASEGGHADFPCQDGLDMKIIRFIRKKRKVSNVNYEELLSGRGIEAIYEFLSGEKSKAAGISKARDKDSRKAMKIFVKYYARCAKNFALDTLSSGGVYIAGGIAVKNKDMFKTKGFTKEFCDADKFSSILSRVPVYIITNYDISILGAASILNAKTKIL